MKVGRVRVVVSGGGGGGGRRDNYDQVWLSRLVETRRERRLPILQLIQKKIEI